MILRSLRFRLTLFFALGVALLLVSFGFSSYYYLKESLFREHDRALETHISSLIMILNSKIHTTHDKSQNLVIQKKNLMELADSIIVIISEEIYDQFILNPKNHYYQVFSPGDTIITESANMGNNDLPIESGQMNRIVFTTIDDFKGIPIRLAIFKDANYTIAIGRPLKETMSVLSDLFTIFNLLIPFSLIILIIGGWYLTHRSLKPIEEMTKIAKEITTKHLHKRINTPKRDDEIGRLILTLNDMIDRLEKSFEKIQQFSADASHELRTPLTILIGELQNALQEQKQPIEYRQIISNAIDEILAMSRIVDDLLTLYKSDVDQMVLEVDEINLSKLVEEIFEDTQIISMRKNIAVKLDIKSVVHIRGDKIRLRQLFLNIIENAVKYNRENGEILINLDKVGQNAVLSISDSGVGIPSEIGDRIFDRFYMVDKSRTRLEGSTGLGLAISKWIAEKHGGKIEYKSEVEKGSIFFIYLPLI